MSYLDSGSSPPPHKPKRALLKVRLPLFTRAFAKLFVRPRQKRLKHYANLIY